MSRVLIVAPTTGYQTRAFDAAAASLGVELTYATDRCKGLVDPWADQAVAVRFHRPEASVDAILRAHAERPLDGVIGLGDRPAVVAAHAAAALGLPWHPPRAAEASASKLLTRGRLSAADLPVPWFVTVPIDRSPDEAAGRVRFPCVVKPVALSGSRGVIRADDAAGLRAAFARVRAILIEPEIRRLEDPANDEVLIEGFVAGHEYALEGVLEHGMLRVFAIFDKPDPLDGPFFEETIYATPPPVEYAEQRRIAGTVAHAAAAIGLRHGPVHAEVRVSDAGVFVLEVAARPIGGLCSRSLRFATTGRADIPLEELLLRHARGESLDGYGREHHASAVMMVPIPRRGRYRGVEGLDVARAVPGIDELFITAKAGQDMVPLPEGHSYLGFIFARASTTAEAVTALRDAHARLSFVLDTALDVTRG